MTNEGKEKTEDFINTTTSTNFIELAVEMFPMLVVHPTVPDASKQQNYR